MIKWILLLVIFIFLLFNRLEAQEKVKFLMKNQASAWTLVQQQNPFHFQLGGRYLPALELSKSVGQKSSFDMEIALNAYGNLLFRQTRFVEERSSVDPYRMWARFSTNRFEIRAGLQKINFGSATILRPLMWFDKMDFRDPLQLTKGVYGLLGRYYFQNNVNFWLWVLRGNNELKGWEVVPAKKNVNEYGGRFQLPVLKGEFALSYHWRQADYSQLLQQSMGNSSSFFPENLMGIDGKWDIGPGIWFEYVIKKNDPDNPFASSSEHFFNLGLDYTFSWGNGLNVLTEYFQYNNNAETDESRIKNQYTAMAVNYPFGIVNTISTMVYYNWDTRDWYRFLNLTRDFDYWSFHVIAYWNPESTIYRTGEGNNLFTGKGLQFMAVVNF